MQQDETRSRPGTPMCAKPGTSTGRHLPESIAIFDWENNKRLHDLDFVANFSRNSFAISSDGAMLATIDGTYLKLWSLK